MSNKVLPILTLLLLLSQHVSAQDKLILDLDLENDLLSLSHNIDKFLFTATRNYQAMGESDINNMNYHSLKNHLAATGLVRLNGEVIGTATEQEIVYEDKENGGWKAHSMWMFQLNHKGLTGFMAVEQREDASKVSNLVQQVMTNPGNQWDDIWQMFLSTDGETRMQYASGDLKKYQDGKFEEYNGINPADLKNFGKFRGRIQFIVFPAQ
ncbi:MAG: hypothetical protein GKR93_00140 [Gammaproteobacteria bacterium]|nr:hypothetical protein [Gammaproteobacteria bacterium]